MSNSPLVNGMVPLIEKVTVSPSTEPWIAWRKEPTPASLGVVTVKVAARAAALKPRRTVADDLKRETHLRQVFALIIPFGRCEMKQLLLRQQHLPFITDRELAKGNRIFLVCRE
jgi:hypothetical protein